MNLTPFHRELILKAIPPLLKDPKDRTYADRYDIWMLTNYMMEQKTLNNYSEGEEIEIYDGEKLARGEIKHLYDGSDFPEWFKNWGKYFGREVKTYPPESEEIYTLIGMSYTYLDYYYILERKNRRKIYHTCVGGIKLKEDTN